MTILLIILILFIAALGVALYFQMKGAKEQAEEGQQLLKDYQKRVNELEKLLKDYSDLQKNFDSVGEGYEQALLQFDKMEEERQTMANVKEKLEKQINDIMAAKSTLEQAVVQKKDLIQKAADDIKKKLDFSAPNAQPIAQLANSIQGLKNVDDKSAFYTDFASGLILGSNNLVTNQTANPVTSTLQTLVQGTDLSKVAQAGAAALVQSQQSSQQTVQQASEKAESKVADAVELISDAKDEVSSTIESLTSIFSMFGN